MCRYPNRCPSSENCWEKKTIHAYLLYDTNRHHGILILQTVTASLLARVIRRDGLPGPESTADQARVASFAYMRELTRLQGELAREHPDPNDGHRLVGFDYREVMQLPSEGSVQARFVWLESLPIWWACLFRCPVFFGEFVQLETPFQEARS
ncbi:hypothetical protein CLAIMM_07486 [Cladophialophora immunda]|nr:hypothetical protein CLAIMM_07486 [Cladophialophora immunda]